MGDLKISGNAQEISQTAGSGYIDGIGYSFEDARGGLRYALKRLSLLGITDQDREQLTELARVASQELDVTEAATRIVNSQSASPLAVAIAVIVNQAQPNKKMALFGAVLGAFAGMGNALDPDGTGILKAILGAIGGAVGVSTATVLQSDVTMNSWKTFWDLGQP